jgi:putative oxidoreductase
MFYPNLESWQPRMLSLLRFMAGLLLLQHGCMKFLGFPAPYTQPMPFGGLLWFSGIIELVGGALLVIGLFTRPVAFICSGFTAFAYFIAHAPRGFFPILNGGELAVLYCFVFFYLVFAGPGPISVDARRGEA